MTYRHSCWYVTAGFLTAMALGCSDGLPERVPVSGRVVIDGQPLTSGTIRFKPTQGRVATGVIQSDGSFTMSTFEDGDGVVPGTHAVTVSSKDESDPNRVRYNVPMKYRDPHQSGLSETIERPTESLVIHLTWDGRPGPLVKNVPSSD
jgi:hypothetical protein